LSFTWEGTCFVAAALLPQLSTLAGRAAWPSDRDKQRFRDRGLRFVWSMQL